MSLPATKASALAACASAFSVMPEHRQRALIAQNGPIAGMAVATIKRIIWPKR
jgi:hypothetical protein